MTWSVLLAVLIVIMLALLAPGLWIAIALGITGIIGLYMSGTERLISTVSDIAWNASNDFILTAVPLFLFMGEVILESGISGKFYRGIAKLLNRIPGNLLHSNIVACAIFSALSGSSVATAAGIGSIAIPEMRRVGYENKLIYGSLAAGGTLGILIPPSISLIIYGAMTDESVVKLFTAAIIPGIILTILFLIYTGVKTFQKGFGAELITDVNISILAALKGISPMIILIVLTMGALYTGFATPTEAAGVGAFLSIVFGFIFGDLNLKKIRSALISASKTTSMIVFIMIGAQIFSFTIVSSGINRELVQAVANSGYSKWMVLIIIYIIYIILGFFMDGNSIVFLTIPLLYPIILNLGFDPIWFGVVMVVLIELGLITPPLGLNLFVIQGIARCSLSDVVIGSIPYMFIMLIMLAILTFFPWLTAFSPGF